MPEAACVRRHLASICRFSGEPLGPSCRLSLCPTGSLLSRLTAPLERGNSALRPKGQPRSALSQVPQPPFSGLFGEQLRSTGDFVHKAKDCVPSVNQACALEEKGWSGPQARRRREEEQRDFEQHFPEQKCMQPKPLCKRHRGCRP